MEKKHWCKINTLSEKAYKGAVLNQALTSLHGGSLEITLTVPLTVPYSYL